ncbi:hypothetical protein T01_2367 [Trichinella spiralis]|uniref:Uncharacterized protein n=1 Tax=Trichinella spiralis TaxID=6334 RepID=A0A0V1B4H3_TRISP|nr:hypothetical protein T01_2367 [Trichinella spiralis]
MQQTLFFLNYYCMSTLSELVVAISYNRIMGVFRRSKLTTELNDVLLFFILLVKKCQAVLSAGKPKIFFPTCRRCR